MKKLLAAFALSAVVSGIASAAPMAKPVLLRGYVDIYAFGWNYPELRGSKLLRLDWDTPSGEEPYVAEKMMAVSLMWATCSRLMKDGYEMADWDMSDKKENAPYLLSMKMSYLPQEHHGDSLLNVSLMINVPARNGTMKTFVIRDMVSGQSGNANPAAMASELSERLAKKLEKVLQDQRAAP
ncbi:MAG: hypothetical protein KGI60_00600 [Patescibacteria group bacterium]|nr:hypothetical protein [Patescibacteria group bacterium]